MRDGRTSSGAPRLCSDEGGVLQLLLFGHQRGDPGFLVLLRRLGLGYRRALPQVGPQRQREADHEGADDQPEPRRPGRQTSAAVRQLRCRLGWRLVLP